MRIAFAGLATSHPFTDAGTLTTADGGCELVVTEPDPERLARFIAAYPGTRVLPDLTALLDAEPDGVVVTVPPPEVPRVLDAVLRRDLPSFVNKPAAATAAQLAGLEAAVARAPHRVLTTSVLRYAPAVRRLGAAEDRSDLLAVRVTVRHDVGRWLAGSTPWQDDPEVGGGTLVTMGLHGVEVLVSLLGTGHRLTAVSAATRRYGGLRSEDTAVLGLRWPDGVLGTVEVLGVAGEESYEVAMHRASGSQLVTMPDLDGSPGEASDPFGYRATMAEFLRMVAGEPSPVPWEQTRAVLATLTEAREGVDDLR
ncbi:MAG: Gfo/Idh/MocA family protein [Micromonosporaceae bacterium]